MDHFAIKLNNQAVKELQNGSLCKALETISLACRITMDRNHQHTKVDPVEYKFHWTNCDHDTFENHSDKAKSSNEPFLYLYFLLITAPEGEDQTKVEEKFCPCVFAWAIWYNMALIYAIAGLVTGEQGRDFLQCADSYLGYVKLRTDAGGDDDKCSKDWCRLQIAVLNNQVCISNELCMYTEAKNQLFEMRRRVNCAYNLMDRCILEEFALNLQCLLKTGDLATAA